LLDEVVDTAQRRLLFRYDRRRRLVAIEQAVGDASRALVRYAYTDAGELASAENGAGEVERYRYDGRHRLAEKVLATGQSFRYQYDPEGGRCVRVVGKDGFHSLELTFDDAAQTTAVTGTAEPRLLTWDHRGAVLREETLDGNWVEAFTFDDDFYVLEETNAAGEVIAHAYDERGHLVELVMPDGIAYRFAYEADRPVSYEGPDGTMKMTYDERGTLRAVEDALGQPWVFLVDAYGRTTGVDGAAGPVWRFEYDDQHNLQKATDALGATQRWEHDAWGRVIAVADPVGRLRRMTYDGADRVVRIDRPDGGVELYRYDGADNLVEVTRPSRRREATDIVGLRAGARDFEPDGSTWQATHDDTEKPKVIINPKGERFELGYDRAGRITEMQSFDGARTRYQYDTAGRVARVEEQDGSWRSFAYDAGGRLVNEACPHGAQELCYDKHGNLVEALLEDHHGNVVVELQRDDLGRIVADLQNGRGVRYAYDRQGRLAERVLPDGKTTRFHYDAVGRLNGLDHDGDKVLLQRDAAGREVRRYAYRGEIDVAQSFDAGDRLTEQWVARGSGAGRAVLVHRVHRYDVDGRPTSTQDDRWGEESYTHDDLDRLIGLDARGHSERFEYDAAGSLVGVGVAGSPSGHWDLAPGNVLKRTQRYRFEYDELRRRVERHDMTGPGEERGVTRTYWDARGSLREVHLPSGAVVHFTYDMFGRRLRKLVVPAPPTTEGEPPGLPRVTEYVWEGDALAMEIDSERGVRTFVHEPESIHPVLQIEGSETFLIVSDGRGWVRELVDAQGQIAWAGVHDAWGRLRKEDAKRKVRCPFRMLGHYDDEETGLAYARYRYFDPEVARWLSPDPLSLAGGPNLFQLPGAPTLVADPLGLGPYTVAPYVDHRGTGYEGHEPVRHSWLRQQGLAGNRRGGTPISAANPSIGLGTKMHDRVHGRDASVGLDYRKYRGMSARQVIDRSIKGLRAEGKIPKAQIDELERQAKATAPKFISPKV
jgi:RHS repeat-associated protein